MDGARIAVTLAGVAAVAAVNLWFLGRPHGRVKDAAGPADDRGVRPAPDGATAGRGVDGRTGEA